MMSTRRTFIKSVLAAAAVPVVLAETQKPKRFPIAFSTLGCPAWDWTTILQRAEEWGYAAIELRGLHGELDLTKRPEFAGDRLAESLEQLRARQLVISDLGASTRLHDPEPAVRTAQLDEAKRYIDLAQRLKVPFIRVFGDRVPAGSSREETIERIGEGLRLLGEHAKGRDVAVLLESHGEFCDSPSLREIFRRADMPTVGLLWDTHHTFVVGKEEPAFTWAQLGPRIRHVHLKDSRPNGKDVRYVLTGQGTVPVRDIMGLLVKQRYPGYFCLEWEKVWHPEIEAPEVAFPHFAKLAREYMLAAGFQPL